MKKFNFNLEAVLDYRQYLERIAQQNTAKAHLDISDCQKQIEGLKDSYAQSRDEIDDVVKEGIKASDLKNHYHYLGGVKGDISNEINRKAKLREVLKEKLLVLKQRSIEKKAMELLKEKRKKEYDDAFRKEEQKLLDEISSLKKARESNNEAV